MTSSNKETTQKTTTELTAEQREMLNLAMPGIRSFAASTPTRYQGSTVAGFDPAQTAGQEMALEAAGRQDQIAKNAADTTSFYTSGNIWDPSVNPYLSSAIDASVRPITETLTESTLPNIRSDAASTGNFGSSRQGIAEGIASGKASQAVGDTASKLAQSQYETNVNAQLKALGLSPTVQNMQTTAATTTSGVGDVRQAQEQELIDEAVNNYNYDQYAQYLQSKDIISLLNSIPGATTVSTGTSPSTNKATSTLGSAAAGASLGSAIMPGVGTAVGAGAGALIPWLFNS